MAEISRLVLKSLVSNEQYCRKVLPFLKAEYFEGNEKHLYKIISSFVAKYNSLPNKTIIESAFANLTVPIDNPTQVQEDIDHVFTFSEDDKKIDDIWLIDQTENWCKDRSVYLAIIKSINIIDGKEKNLAKNAIPDILSKALGVSFDRNIGHDYFENAEERYDFYHKKEDKIPFDLELLNKITKGGVSTKTLNIIMSPTGGGKSLVLCHFAANMLAMGKNVLYITLEMAEERVAERIDANLFDVDMYSISHFTRDEFARKLFDIKKKSHGKLLIKEYPTAVAHAGHFRALIDEIKVKKNFAPDVIIIDYLNICASARLKSVGGSINTYSYVKAIAEEVRGLAIENNVPVFSATQTNRDGMNNSDADITNMSESIGLAATADLILSLVSTEELDALDQVMFKQLKNRYNDITKYRRFIVGIDRSKMKLYDVENTAQDNLVKDFTDITPPVQKQDTSIYSEFKI